MRSVRCDLCGTKALVAASKCPKCGHGFENRDGFGELLPLAHCTSCDAYYPESLGGCRWCGTKPERSPIGPLGPYIWKGFGILTFASLAIGAWLVKNDTSSPSKPAPRSFVADTLPTNQPKTESVGRKIALARADTAVVGPFDSTAVARTDSTHDTAIALATVDTLPSVSTPVVATEPVSIQSAGTVAQPDSVPSSVDTAAEPPPAPVPAPRVNATARPVERSVDRVSERPLAKPAPRTLAKAPAASSSSAPARSRARATAPATARSTAPATARAPAPPRAIAKAPPRAIAKAPPRAASTRAAPAPKAAARTKTRGGWVTSVARNWAVVRSDPTRQSRIIAAIGPNTRVQLGETRGAWRRIKAKGLAGWVEHRTLIASAYSPPKSRLAAR
jgi:hypothetical protein